MIEERFYGDWGEEILRWLRRGELFSMEILCRVCSQTSYLSNLLQQQIFKNCEIYPKKARNLQHFRPCIYSPFSFLFKELEWYPNLHLYIPTVYIILDLITINSIENAQWHVEFDVSGNYFTLALLAMLVPNFMSVCWPHDPTICFYF